MRRSFVVLLFCCCCLPGLAKEKLQYQDGVLISFRTVSTGTSCTSTSNTSGDVNANTDSAGLTSGTVSASTSGSTTCSDTDQTLYTIKSGDNIYVVEAAHSGKAAAAALATAGWSAFFMKRSVLANQLPGTAVKLRSDGNHLFIKVNKKESMFSIVEAK